MRALLLLLLCWAGPATALSLQEDSTIDRDLVLLSDIFADLPAGSDQPIATAPVPGTRLVLDATRLQRVAAQHQLDWQPDTPYARLTIQRAGTHIDSQPIMAAIRTALQQSAPHPAATDYEIVLDMQSPSVTLPAGAAPQIDIINLTRHTAGHRFTADLRFGGDHPDAKTMIVTGRALPLLQIPALRQGLAAGSVITAADITTIPVPANRLPAGLIQDTTAMLGQQLRRRLAAGQPVLERDLQAPILVRRGALVTMQLKSGSLSLTARGRALEEGGSGDVIQIRNIDSNQVLHGTVLADGAVRLDPPAQLSQGGNHDPAS